MKIAVVGAGGVGGYFGGMLADAGGDVTLVARGAHLRAIQQHGLKIEHPNGTTSSRKIKTLDSALPSDSGTESELIGAADLVIVAVKGSQLQDAAQLAKPLCHNTTLILPLLNGITAPAVLEQTLPTQTVLGGLCGIIAHIREPGVIRHVGIEPFVTFGLMPADATRGEQFDQLAGVQSLFERAGVKANLSDDIRLSMWRKYLETQLGAAVALGVEHAVETPALSFTYSALKPQELKHSS